MRKSSLKKRKLASTGAAVVRDHQSHSWRWLALLVGGVICAAVGYFAYEQGKEAAGLSAHAERELLDLRTQVVDLEQQLDAAQTVVNTSESRLTTEKAAQSKLKEEVDRLVEENAKLRDDLGFYENLIPAGDRNKAAIRGLQASYVQTEAAATPAASETAPRRVQWQVLLMHPQKAAKETKGKLYLSYVVMHEGKEQVIPADELSVEFKQHKRYDGVLELPSGHTMVSKLKATLKRGSAILATASVNVES